MIKEIKTFVVLICLIFISCSEPNTPQVLRIGTNIWPGYEPLYLARELNYIDNNKVHLIEYTSASQVIKAYKNGHIDAAALTLDEAITLLATGEQPQLVLVMDISNGADVLLGQPGIKKVTDIKGKRIGVEHTALGAYLIHRVLEINNIMKADISVVPLTVNQHERAFRQKQIDAVLTFEPVRSKLLNDGANILFDSSQVPGEIVDVLIIDAKKRAQFIEHIKHLESGWYRALEDLSKKTPQTLGVLGARMQLNQEDVLKVYEGLILPTKSMNNSLLRNEPEPKLLQTTRMLSQVMAESNLINKVVDTDKLFIKK